MATQFNIEFTAGFSRSLKKLVNKNPEVVELYEEMLHVLKVDPLNLTRKHQIKKLTYVSVGQWRIRARIFRLRYDVSGKTVSLLTICLRNNAYRN